MQESQFDPEAARALSDQCQRCGATRFEGRGRIRRYRVTKSGGHSHIEHLCGPCCQATRETGLTVHRAT
jgi:hypothetical protein